MDKEVSDEIIQKVLVAYKSYIEDKKPLEYILGHVDFFGREFFVNEATLIPRPETEYMINSVTEFINGEPFDYAKDKWRMENGEWKNNLLLDIGTGCGVLWISVLLQNPNYFSQAIFTDYFADALEIAKKNYHTLVKDYSWKVEFLQSDLLDFLVNKSSGSSSLATSLIKEDFSGDVVLVANLPYIPEETFEANVSDNVKKWEPKPAFVGWDDGLDYYKIMLDQIISLKLEAWILKPENFVMFLEMMTWQVDVLRQLYDQDFTFEEVKTFHFNIRILKVIVK